MICVLTAIGLISAKMLMGRTERMRFARDQWTIDMRFTLEQLIADALMTDGGHHKQWYLEQIAAMLGLDIPIRSTDNYKKGIPP